MQLNKIIIGFAYFFIYNLIYSQPTNNIKKEVRVVMEFKGVNNQNINFKTKDSLIFYNPKTKYSFTIKLDRKFENQSNSIIPVYLGFTDNNNAYNPNKKYNSGWNYDFTNDKFLYHFIYSIVEYPRYTKIPNSFIYYDKILIEYKFKNKKMSIKVDFTKNTEVQFEEKKINLSINFQEGNFEVTNPFNPEIVSVK